MSQYSAMDLNKLAMEIILHAGDCRNLVQEAFRAAIENGDDTIVKQLLNEAREKITLAHKLQTDVIQNTILNEDQEMTLLFIHAQDTLMTIHSELLMSENILKLFYSKALNVEHLMKEK